jgi:phage shock protein A
MGILDRAGRVISSNFNALLDQAEDPKKSIEQTLRDMEKQLRLAKSELVRAVAAERQLKNKVLELETEEQRWEKRAELAVQTGDDALARQALAQRKRVQVEKQRTESLRTEQRANALEMKSALSDMERKHQDFSARKNTLATQVGMARAGGGVDALGASPGGGSAFEAFRNIEERIDGVDDVFDAQREVNQMLDRDMSPTGMSSAEVELKFRELEGKTAATQEAEAFDEELSALKQKLRVRVQ